MSQLEDYLLKCAEVSGTTLAPSGAPVNASGASLNPAKTIRKVGGAATLDVDAVQKPVSGEQVQSLPQSSLRVSVTGKEAPKAEGKKEAQYYALPAFQRYPLDSLAQVKLAADYFSEQGAHLEPSLRREYCANLVKRASMVGFDLPPAVRKYGAEDYAPDGEFHAALAMRRDLLKEAMHHEAFAGLLSLRPVMPAEDFAVALGEFDKVAGITEHYDRHVYDPYYSTFGEKRANADDDALLEGNAYVSKNDLAIFARTRAGDLEDAFGKDFVDDFRKDPMGVTKSLPVPQRKMVINLVTSALAGPTPT